MSKRLAFASVIGAVLCAVFLGLARMIGGDDVFHDPRSLEGLRPLIDMATRKEWRWAGGDTLAMDAPMNLRYQPKPAPGTATGAPGIAVTGSDEAMKHVHFRKGRIGSDAAAPRGLKAVVSGVTIRKFVVNSHESLELGHVDQPEMEIYINGSGSVHGDGRVKHLKLVVSGSGDANLGNLSVGDADIAVLGSGTVTLSPHGAVSIVAAGSRRIVLQTKPSSIQRRMVGSAEIVELDAAPQAAPVPMPVPPLPPDGGSVSGESVVLRDSHDMDLGHVDQHRLAVTVLGSGSLKAEGRVDELSIRAMSSGAVRLGKLAARKAVVMLAGDGDVTIAPTQEAQIKIVGSGNVHLLTNPPRITRQVFGSGRVITDAN